MIYSVNFLESLKKTSIKSKKRLQLPEPGLEQKSLPMGTASPDPRTWFPWSAMGAGMNSSTDGRLSESSSLDDSEFSMPGQQLSR